ncbi:MAG: hypothetical protein HETSPECPRED_008866 [Heterodermia speciosa]|uniref:GDT1 family protein n=1 Tax=Heterodermia speciosa TaxID=116794 RepID=A0A8H3ENG7_9LECA|nr:MAG: hypothetical protein HETSPECPRED_008866 [Heterodermia speciosa]
MRLRQRLSPLLLLLIPALHSAHALDPTHVPGHKTNDYGHDVAAYAEGKALKQQELGAEASVSTRLPGSTYDTALRAKDVPIDGKDGRPHTGPFVETSAERDRKKAKEKGNDKKLPAGEKPLSNPIPSGTPDTNDGVMDDPYRKGPKEGTRGTEGGISEKSREKEGQLASIGDEGKKPDPPKEVPPLPHSEQEEVGTTDPSKKTADAGTDDGDKQKEKELGGLEKPEDLPDKPHDIPHPEPAGTSKSDPLAILAPFTPSIPLLASAPASLIQPLHSFLLSLTMIIFSEIGDKTFLIAALMAMKHSRLVVFTAAFSALICMTILSAVLGHAVPTLIPKRFTNFLAAVLFLVFGAKMLREGYAIPREQGVSEEMKEVEMELEEKEEMARKAGRRRSSLATPYMLESGRSANGRKARSNTRLPAPPDSPPSSPDSRSPSPGSRGSGFSSALAGINNLFSLLLSPAWVQTFIMTFLGEWGDRSQIATIAMAAGSDYWWVTGGAVTGHALCTAGAVIGGRAIAGRVSLRVGE